MYCNDALKGTAKGQTVCPEVFNLLNARTPTNYEERNFPSGGVTQWGDVIDKMNPLGNGNWSAMERGKAVDGHIVRVFTATADPCRNEHLMRREIQLDQCSLHRI